MRIVQRRFRSHEISLGRVNARRKRRRKMKRKDEKIDLRY